MMSVCGMRRSRENPEATSCASSTRNRVAMFCLESVTVFSVEAKDAYSAAEPAAARTTLRGRGLQVEPRLRLTHIRITADGGRKSSLLIGPKYLSCPDSGSITHEPAVTHRVAKVDGPLSWMHFP